MATSGLTAIPTTDDNPVTLLSATETGGGLHQLVMVNEDAVPGAFSLDSGATWQYWPVGITNISIGPLGGVLVAGAAVKFKRVASGTNATKLWAWGF